MIIYIGVPYSHPDPAVREARFNAVNIASAHLMGKCGLHVFSPISHTHPIALVGDLPVSWEYWQEYDRKLIAVCGMLIILKLDGWEQSTGVNGEVKIANEYGIPVKHFTLDEILAMESFK